MNDLEQAVSKYRLDGEPCPADLACVLREGAEFLDRMMLAVNGDPDWQPWNDRSYLSEEDLKNSDVAANVKAFDDVYKHINFVAATEDGEYFGYWRGIERLPIAASPMVHCSNDRQITLCGNRFVEALFFHVYDDELLEEFRQFANEHGLELTFKSIDDIDQVETQVKPDAYHIQQYEIYRS